MKQKIFKFKDNNSSELQEFIQDIHLNNKKLVFTNGCFDILHVGHLRYLHTAKTLGNVLIVGLNSDVSVKSIKGPSRPVIPEQERAEMLLGLKSVDAVAIFDDDTPKKLIEFIKPNILVKGGDWAINKIVGADFVTSYGGEVKNITFEAGYSTTKLIEKIKLSLNK